MEESASSSLRIIMKTLSALSLLLILPILSLAQVKLTSRIKPLVFTHVTVIDATSAPPQPDMSVVIIGGRIKAIGETQKLTAPRNARVVDARGKFLIPGLWDMHVHTFWGRGSESFLPLFVANGVTGIRDMGAPLAGLPWLKRWR